MGPSFVDNVVTILKVVGIGYLSLTGLSVLGVLLIGVYEKLLKGEVISTQLIKEVNPVPQFTLVNRLRVHKTHETLLNRVLAQRHDVSVGSAEISAEPYFHEN